jgi:oxygen-independent coproporphyrinogen III oxidase
MPHPAPRAAYLHVPFCRHRCGYCNFTLIAGRDDLVDNYLEALERELTALQTPRPVDTIFLGGGTPSHLDPPRLARLLALVRHWFPPAPGYEFSLEANPSDIDEARLATAVAAGATRISLGVQSFDAAKLTLLERDHSAAVVRRSVELVKQAGLALSLDLIFAAPGETLDGWRRDLDQAIGLEPDHLSLYGLTFERGTAYWSRREKGELAGQDEESERAMYLEAIDRLAGAGFEQYEISNFARPGRRCRHNETYWAAREYYAAGPGAARYVAGVRETNHRSTTTWLQRVMAGESPVAETEQLEPEDRAREALVLGLRRVIDGVDRRAFAAEFGYEIDALGGTELPKLIASNLLEDDNGRLRLTREGILLADWIWSKFIRC